LGSAPSYQGVVVTNPSSVGMVDLSGLGQTNRKGFHGHPESPVFYRTNKEVQDNLNDEYAQKGVADVSSVPLPPKKLGYSSSPLSGELRLTEGVVLPTSPY
jgi:hypothetical protein